MGKTNTKKSRTTLVDDFGMVDETYKDAKKGRDDAKDELIADGVDHEGSFEGNAFVVNVAEVPMHTLDKEKILKKIGASRYASISSVSIEKLKDLMTKAQIDECIVETKTTLRFSAKRKK